jgi:hypothetical protein
MQNNKKLTWCKHQAHHITSVTKPNPGMEHKNMVDEHMMRELE